MSPEEILAATRELGGDRLRDGHVRFGEATVVVERDAAPALFAEMRDRAELSFNLLSDLTVVDYLGRVPRFEVVYHLYSLQHAHRLRVKVAAPEEEPWVHSLVDLWKAANWLEREAWDMFGIRFVGHPDPRRILMYEEFVGHPLRKDYPHTKRQPLTEERDPIETGWKFDGER
jgi:NADH-quinone oxidoreductase subunit C